MLSIEQRLISDSFRYPGGMLNVAWIAGYLRNRDKPVFHIMASNNEDTMIPIHLKKGEKIPHTYQERAPVRSICFVSGVTGEDGNRYPKLTAIGFDFATVLDVSLDAAFEAAFQPKKEAAEGAEDAFKPFKGKETRLSASANMVKLAGFVQAVSLKRASADGTPARCTMLIRQREDESVSIPVVYEGRLAEPVAQRIARGTPTKIHAVFQMAAERDKEGNKIYVPRLLAARPPEAVSRNDFRGVLPEWAHNMVEEMKAARGTRQAPEGANAKSGVAVETIPKPEPASVIDQI